MLVQSRTETYELPHMNKESTLHTLSAVTSTGNKLRQLLALPFALRQGKENAFRNDRSHYLKRLLVSALQRIFAPPRSKRQWTYATPDNHWALHLKAVSEGGAAHCPFRRLPHKHNSRSRGDSRQHWAHRSKPDSCTWAGPAGMCTSKDDAGMISRFSVGRG